MAVRERAVITDASQPVSSSSMVFGQPTTNGDVVLYVSDYVNGQIQQMTTSAGTTTTTGKWGECTMLAGNSLFLQCVFGHWILFGHCFSFVDVFFLKNHFFWGEKCLRLALLKSWE
jgi:hypothetical protein